MIPIHRFIAAKLRLAKSGGNWAVARQKALGGAIDHIKYLANRPGPDLEQGGREFFDDQGSEINQADVRSWVKEQYPGRNVVVHKLTLAPDINLNADDEETYARHMMQELSDKLGQDLDWKAVVHHNTSHHHMHVLISPRDKAGGEVRISKDDCNHLERASDEYISREYPYLWKHVVEPSREEREREKADRSKAVTLDEIDDRDQFQPSREANQVIPFLGPQKKALIKEVLLPYEQWKKQNPGPEDLEPPKDEKKDCIEYRGQEYSFDSAIENLKQLDSELWDQPPDEWLPKSEYRKLRNWIELKEEGRTLDEPTKEDPKYNYLEPSTDPDKISYTYMHPLMPETPGEAFTRFEERTVEVTKDSDREALGELSLAMRYNNLKERHFEEQETRLAPVDEAKFKHWFEEKNKQWGLELADTVFDHVGNQESAEELHQDFMDRASGGGGGVTGGGAVTAALVEQDQKPGQARPESKIIELPVDEIEQVKTDLHQLSHYKYQDWLAREGSQQLEQRRDDDRQMRQIQAALRKLERAQKDKYKREFDDRIKKQDELMLDIDDF